MSFHRPLIDAHFRFALFVLDILAEVNTIFQERFGFLPHFWKYVAALRSFFRQETFKMEKGDFSRFPYLRNFERASLGQFVCIMKSLVLNLTVRFYDISASLQKSKIDDYLDYEHALIRPGAPIQDRPLCGIDKLFDVYFLIDELVRRHLQEPRADQAVRDEWGQFMGVVAANRGSVEAKSREKMEAFTTREKDVMNILQMKTVPDIIDAFGVVPRDDFLGLWGVVVRLLTILPTTVSCEQSFSYFKRTLHTNMSGETAKFFLYARLSLYNYNYDL